MPSRRKRSTANKPVPSSTPYFPAFYPQYGYNPSPYNPIYDYPGYTYDPSNYIYYPVDQYGQVIGPPTRFPPIGHNPSYDPNLYDDTASTISNHGSRIHSPRRTQLSHRERESHHPPPPPLSHRAPSRHHSSVHHAYERSTHENFPPIHRYPFAYTRPISPNDDELRFAVRDLTERRSTSSVLSHADAIKSVKHYDKLQKSYN